MDLDQLIKRVKWLDEERRADKIAIVTLQERIAKLEGLLDRTNTQLKEQGTELTEARTFVERIGKFEDALEKHRTKVKKELDGQNENTKRREKTARKRQDEEITEIRENTNKVEVRMVTLEKIRPEFLDLKENFTRMDRVIGEQREQGDTLAKQMDDALRTVQQSQTEQRQESRRVMDVQGEVSALRKRVDEFKIKMQLLSDDQHKHEVRLSDISSQEVERREAQSTFLDRVTTTQADQERNWKNWKKTFAEVEKQSNEVHGILQNMGDTERAVKQAQTDFEEITGQISRRINEITEMQRLGEERFRQEWGTFRADDQKRWTNYTLTQEEIQRESSRHTERLSDQTTGLEENLQELQDIVQHISDQNDKMLQAFLGHLRDWVTDNDRFMNSVR